MHVVGTVAADGNTAIIECLFPGREGDPFTLPAREAISLDGNNILKQAGIYMHASKVDPTGRLVLNSRGFEVKVFLVNSDVDLLSNLGIGLKNILISFCSVSILFLLSFFL